MDTILDMSSPRFPSRIESDFLRRQPLLSRNQSGPLRPIQTIQAFNNSARISASQSPTSQPIGGIFKWSQPFKPTNPIHTLFSIELEVLPLPEIQKAYAKLATILERVRQRITPDLTPYQKLKLVYDVMLEMGITFYPQKDSLFTNNLNNNFLDCDTSSFVVMAVAHEMGWPLYLVVAPEHVFVRWDDGKGTRFNMDQGKSFPDPHYVVNHFATLESVASGVYLQNLDRNEIQGLFLSNRGDAKYQEGNGPGALQDYEASFKFYPQNTRVYRNIGIIKNDSKDFWGAYEALHHVLELDPQYTTVHKHLGYALVHLGNFAEGIEEYKLALADNPDADTFSNCTHAQLNWAIVKREAGDSAGALAILNQILVGQPENVDALHLRGIIKSQQSNFLGALRDLSHTLRLQPKNAETYNDRGATKNNIGLFQKAIEDFDEAIRISPCFAMAYFNRGNAKANMGNYLSAIGDFRKAKLFDPKNSELYEAAIETTKGKL